jgi:hypothetical protein
VDRPEEENELYGDWLRKTVGLYAVDFPTDEAQKPLPALQIDYLRGEQLLGTLELIEDLSEDEDSPQRYRARGESTPGDVIVPRFAALEIMQDLDNLLGDEGPRRSEEVPSLPSPYGLPPGPGTPLGSKAPIHDLSLPAAER